MQSRWGRGPGQPPIRLPSPGQIRGARAMLGWSLLDFAETACLSVATVGRMETTGTRRASEEAYAKALEALETAGVRLSFDGRHEGVSLAADVNGSARRGEGGFVEMMSSHLR